MSSGEEPKTEIGQLGVESQLCNYKLCNLEQVSLSSVH